MALNGLISVPSESSNKLPTEVSDELASIQDAGIYVFETDELNSLKVFSKCV